MATFSRSAEFEWHGNVTAGGGRVLAASDAFSVRVTFPRTLGEPPGLATPEELLAASHATCYGIGLRSLIERRGGRATHVAVTATVTAQKGPEGIRIQSSTLSGVVEGLEGIDATQLESIAQETEERCTISVALRGSVKVSSHVAIT
jgi:osmotically inducible protein OsmC